MQIAPEQAQLIGAAGRADRRAGRVLEIGCFTGYGTLAMALALPAGRPGDDPRRQRATGPSSAAGPGARPGVEDRIEMRLGPRAGQPGCGCSRTAPPDSFDLIFVDADKKSYDAYYERALRAGAPGRPDRCWTTCCGAARVADPADRDHQTAGAARPSTPSCTPTSGSSLALAADRRRPDASRAERPPAEPGAQAQQVDAAGARLVDQPRAGGARSTAPGIRSSPITKAGVPSMPSASARARSWP